MLERDVHVPARGKEQRGVGQRVSHGDRLDIGGERLARVERRDSQGLVQPPRSSGSPTISSQMAWAIPPGSRGPGGKGSMTRKWMPLMEKIDGLGDERGDRVLAVLVPRRDDLDHRHDLAELVVDRDAVGLPRIEGRFGLEPAPCA